MTNIKLTQVQLLEILEAHYRKGNENIHIKTIDFINEMIKYIETVCTANTVNTK